MKKLLLAIATICLTSCCCMNSTEHEKLRTLEVIVAKQDSVIKAYDVFRTHAIDIYLNQVDSTGDGFDETDKGVDFWTSSAKVDSLLFKLNCE